MATQDELKRQAAQKAVEYVNENEYLGIGTGSTVYFLLRHWHKVKSRLKVQYPHLP